MSEFERERNINFLISKINNEVDTYLSREPRPSLTMIADYFGFSDLVEVNLRKKSMTLHIPDLKKDWLK